MQAVEGRASKRHYRNRVGEMDSVSEVPAVAVVRQDSTPVLQIASLAKSLKPRRSRKGCCATWRLTWARVRRWGWLRSLAAVRALWHIIFWGFCSRMGVAKSALGGDFSEADTWSQSGPGEVHLDCVPEPELCAELGA